jgi:AraC family transcriptional regulator of adaptative response / DNA-3-methyladenine glycosylase II
MLSLANASYSEEMAPLDPGICWQAIYARDPRFDGRFFAAATSTGLYCRNVCPVPFAQPRNIVLFAHAAAAEAAGFRPCKRCQPQAAPGTPAWTGTSAVVSRALRLLLAGALNEGSVEQLAERLGLGARQLRRLFVQHLGASPVKIASTQRLHLARKLIAESSFPMTEIAFHSGFKSIREFNHAVRAATGQSPTQLRLARGASCTPPMQTGLELRLPYKKPFDWPALLAFLEQRAIPGIELISGSVYRRTIEIAGARGYLTVNPLEAKSRLLVQLDLNCYEPIAQAVERIRRIFDLAADPLRIAGHLSRDPKLQPGVAARPGLRVPGVWDGFEAAVLAVLGQTLTAPGSKRLMARLVRTLGCPLETPLRGLNRLFPTPEAIAACDLSQIGVPRAAALTLRKLTCPALRKHLQFQTSTTFEEAVSQLTRFAGLDESTANYIAMRAFGEPDAFPLIGLPLTEAAQWRPWRAYGAMHLAGS